jgi:hypothetical protein
LGGSGNYESNKNGMILEQKSVGELIKSGYTTIKLLSLSKHPLDILPTLVWGVGGGIILFLVWKPVSWTEFLARDKLA